VLRVYETGVGLVWSVHNVKTDEWVQVPVYSGDINEAKAEAEKAATAIARHLLRRAGSKEGIPTITWKAV
jgi:hypothetical protein